MTPTKRFNDTSADAQLSIWAIWITVSLLIAFFVVNTAAYLSVRYGSQPWDFEVYLKYIYPGLTIVFLLSMVVYARWLYYAYKNISLIGRLQFSPKWAVAMIFIPVLNLLYPGRIMEEIWFRLQVMNGARTGGNNYISVWWYLYFATVFFLLIMAFLATPDYKFHLTRNMAASAMMIISGLSLIKVIRQTAAVERTAYRNYSKNFPEDIAYWE